MDVTSGVTTCSSICTELHFVLTCYWVFEMSSSCTYSGLSQTSESHINQGDEGDEEGEEGGVDGGVLC